MDNEGMGERFVMYMTDATKMRQVAMRKSDEWPKFENFLKNITETSVFFGNQTVEVGVGRKGFWKRCRAKQTEMKINSSFFKEPIIFIFIAIAAVILGKNSYHQLQTHLVFWNTCLRKYENSRKIESAHTLRFLPNGVSCKMANSC